jgi:hypothetical protein
VVREPGTIGGQRRCVKFNPWRTSYLQNRYFGLTQTFGQGDFAFAAKCLLWGERGVPWI